jgi:gliding motility-associated-like protein
MGIHHHRKHSILGLFLLLALYHVQGQQVTTLPICMVVNPDSSMVIMPEFEFTAAYYADEPAGPFQPFQETDTTQSGNKILLNPILFKGHELHWFYFESTSFSDTISNLILSAQAENQESRIRLTSSIPFTSSSSWLDSNLFFSYQILTDTGWGEVASTSLLDRITYDTISGCLVTNTYRVQLIRSTPQNCMYLSLPQEREIKDEKAPQTPITTRISVDTLADFAYIEWQKPSDPDVFGYRIAERTAPNTNIWLDSIMNVDNTFYVDSNSVASSQIYSYVLVAFDSCINSANVGEFIPYNTSPLTDDTAAHSSILMQYDWEACDSILTLTWNAYDKWPQGISGYEVYERVSSSSFQLLEILPPEDTTIRIYKVDPNETYCFAVKAISSDPSIYSISNIECKFPDFTLIPNPLIVTGIQENTGEGWIVPWCFEPRDDLIFSGFEVARRKAGDPDFVSLGFVPYNPVLNTYAIADKPAFYDQIVYEYRVQVIDVCGSKRVYDNAINALVLRVDYDAENEVNLLTWNQASNRSGLVQGFEIQRTDIETGEIASFFVSGNSFQNTFEDQLSEIPNTGGYFCYQVISLELQNDTLCPGKSSSNFACIVLPQSVWIPNSFTPNGDMLNDVFLPVALNVSSQNYQMNIYDRYGRLIFSTDSKYEGWNGMHNGKLMPVGVYAYLISYSDASGLVRQEKGTVQLLR